MSIGLLINSIKAWYYGTFQPAGYGPISGSEFYPAHIVLHSSPSDFCQAVWIVGTPTASLVYNGITTTIELNNVGSMLTALGRETGYMTLQNLINGIDRAQAYINPLAIDHISGIDVRSVLPSGTGTGTPSGSYNPLTEEINLDSNLFRKEDNPNDWYFNLCYASTIIHEFRHAYDLGEGLLTTIEEVEQSGSIQAMTFIKDTYNAEDPLTLGSYKIAKYEMIYAQEKANYVNNGGTDPQWDNL